MDITAIQHALEKINVHVKDPSILSHCTRLCAKYQASPDEIATKWEVIVANGEAKELTDDTVDLLEQKFKAESALQYQSKRNTTHKRISTKETLLQKKKLGGRRGSMLSSYGVKVKKTTAPPLSNNAKEKGTTSTSKVVMKKKLTNTRRVRTHPPGTLLDSYHHISTDRTGEEEGEEMKQMSSSTNDDKDDTLAALRSAGRKKGTQSIPVQPIKVVSAYRYMAASVFQKATGLESRELRVGRGVAGRGRLSPSHSHDHYTQESIDAVGRVCCDSEAQLNTASVMLEASKDGHNERVRLQLAGLKEFTVFPGQIVGCKGNNPTGKALVVTSLHTDAPLPKYKGRYGILGGSEEGGEVHKRARVEEEEEEEEEGTHGHGMDMMVAAGPYTSSGDLEYEPLDRLMDMVVLKHPDLLILCGPFVDEEHPYFCIGGTESDGNSGGGGGVDCTMEVLFRSVVWGKIAAGLDRVQRDGYLTNLVLIPSTKDLTHTHTVFPQPAFSEDFISLIKPPPSSLWKVNSYSNPCTLMMGGLAVGTSTADVLHHLQEEELARKDGRPMPHDIKRLASHLVNQQSFYPVFPPSPSLPLDASHLSGVDFLCTPDVLILPSQEAPFCKLIADEVVAINPGFMAHPTRDSSYASLTLLPTLHNTPKHERTVVKVLTI